MNRTPLPDVFPPRGSRVRVPATGGGWIKTFCGEPRQDDTGAWVIPCVGCGEVPAGQVHPILA